VDTDAKLLMNWRPDVCGEAQEPAVEDLLDKLATLEIKMEEMSRENARLREIIKACATCQVKVGKEPEGGSKKPKEAGNEGFDTLSSRAESACCNLS
jgi:hypothetical protein